MDLQVTDALFLSLLCLLFPTNDDSENETLFCIRMLISRQQHLKLNSSTHLDLCGSVHFTLLLLAPVLSACRNSPFTASESSHLKRNQLTELLITLSHSHRASPHFCCPWAQMNPFEGFLEAYKCKAFSSVSVNHTRLLFLLWRSKV